MKRNKNNYSKFNSLTKLKLNFEKLLSYIMPEALKKLWKKKNFEKKSWIIRFGRSEKLHFKFLFRMETIANSAAWYLEQYLKFCCSEISLVKILYYIIIFYFRTTLENLLLPFNVQKDPRARTKKPSEELIDSGWFNF